MSKILGASKVNKRVDALNQASYISNNRAVHNKVQEINKRVNVLNKVSQVIYSRAVPKEKLISVQIAKF